MHYERWQKEKNRLLYTVLSLQSVFVCIVWQVAGKRAMLIAALSSLCIISGFWVTEQLIGVFTSVKKANQSAIFLLCAAKLSWWIALFYLSKQLDSDDKIFLAAAFGVSLVGIMFFALLRQGWPKISESSK